MQNIEKRNLKKQYRKNKKALRFAYRSDKNTLWDEYLESMTELMLKDGKKAPNNPPKRALIEEIGNAVSHVVVYSIGIIPFIMKGKVAHFIWHLFVLGGAVVQWLGIYLVIYLS